MRVQEIRKQATVESDHLTSHNRLIARQREDDLAMLKEQYSEVQAMYSARVKALESKLTATRKKCVDWAFLTEVMVPCQLIWLVGVEWSGCEA